MSDEPLLSIVTATRNRRDLLERCIESVARQAYERKEHVVVDGASTDGTVELLTAAAAKHPHLRWISEPDSGLSEALNKGLALARGDLVAVLGDDDFYEPGAFQVIAREARLHPEAGVISGHCHVVDNRGERVDFLRAGYTNWDDLVKWWTNWTQSVMLPAPSSFIRAEVLDVVGGFDEEDPIAMDYHHFIKIARRFPVRIADEVVANHRWDHGSLSFSQMQETWASMGRISRKYWGPRSTLRYYRLLLSYLRYWPGRRLRRQVNFVRTRLGLSPR